MDYQSRHPDDRSPNFGHKHLPSHSWSRSDQPPSQPPPQHNTHSFVPASGSIPSVVAQILDPESEDSDVSITEGDYGVVSPFPVGLPQTPSKHQLDNAQTIDAHLSELTRVEDFNIKKHNRLKEKRARKDERVLRKRAIQDEKIRGIMDARQRRDAKTALRREREDIAFQRFYETLEEEESRLRQRLKRLKRGLPPDDVAPYRGIPNAPSSPIQTYSTVPPPAKRHQSAHPGHHDQYARPPESTTYSATPPPHPSYHFYPASGLAPLPPPPPPPVLPQTASSHPGPYQRSPPHPERSPRGSPAMSYTRTDYRPSHREALRQDDSPRIQAHPITLHNEGSVSSLQRHSSSSYDTRPPPPTMSTGFASINQPPNSGFAAVNARDHNTPPPKQRKRPHRNSDDREVPSRGGDEDDREERDGSGKRTPSTTHPYQMSEAFANRHHHCERTDTINRGIWTWYGHGGTAERPMEQPTEMYLRCNHDGCGRIDWRTVHGLQCHIVKNHDQPKGTIGSLEKALERYGVPVRDIEAIEEREGLGAGGTMADPKNQKARAKNRESAAARRVAAVSRDTPATPEGRTPGPHKSLRPEDSYSPTQPSAEQRSTTSRTSYPQVYDIQPSSVEEAVEPSDRPESRSVAGFASVNNHWQSTDTDRGKDEQSEPRLADVPHHPGVDSTHQPTPYTHQAPYSAQTPFWSSVQPSAEPARAATQAPSSSLNTPGTDSVPPAASSVTSFPPSSTERDVTDSTAHPDKQASRTTDTELTGPEGGPEAAQSDMNKPLQLDTSPPGPHPGMVPVARETTKDAVPAQSIEDLASRESVGQEVDTPAVSTTIEPREPLPAPLSPMSRPINRSTVTSPEVPNKRTMTRRESRRSSIATPNRGPGVDREHRRGYEDPAPAHSSTAPEQTQSATADDEDSIVVVVASGLDRQREDGDDGGDDRTKIPSRKLSNGRVLRKLRA